MDKKGKLILFLCVSIPAFYLVRKLLIVSGLAIVGEVATYLFLGVVGFILVNILIPKEYRAWANLLPALCILILLVTGIVGWHQSYKDNKQVKRDTLGEKSDKRAIEIWANIKVKKALQEEKLLSQRKSSQIKKSYSRRTVISQERVVETPTSTWGGLIATSTFPEVVNSWSRFAQKEARKAMQRVANQGRRVKIE